MKSITLHYTFTQSLLKNATRPTEAGYPGPCSSNRTAENGRGRCSCTFDVFQQISFFSYPCQVFNPVPNIIDHSSIRN
ncbi:unnamed protein product [Ceratitis capitata]|uniref:(Mediterranean fruit fly) hypothetical protein n=1 Tax=Ceratitis capitata TaxID=7213 RepID=A0A811UL16_CERCA|nr:unnamed protein product [Ceratitis capitata]